jgi:hypothetical protein
MTAKAPNPLGDNLDNITKQFMASENDLIERPSSR